MLRGIDEYGFARSRACFEEIVGFLDGEGANALSHADLEDRLNIEGRELLRLLYQDHLDLRAEREQANRIACALASRLPWARTAPFGDPVVPEV